MPPDTHSSNYVQCIYIVKGFHINKEDIMLQHCQIVSF